MSITAKSVIIDIADNWGSATRVGIRSVEFKLSSSLITVNLTTAAFYATTTNAPLYNPDHAFDTSLSKTGSPVNVSWSSNAGNPSSQRLIVVFNSPETFDEIVINNFHDYGTSSNSGAKNIVIQSSTDAITDTTYGASISNSTSLFNDQIDAHIASDSIDDQSLTLGVTVAAVSFESTSVLSAEIGASTAIIADSFDSVSALSAKAGNSVVADTLDGIGAISAIVAEIVAAAALESTGELSQISSVFLSADTLDGTGAISAIVADTLAAAAMESSGGLSASQPVILKYINPSILFFFILTGQPDSLEDVQIPIRSFQARHRTGKPTYLSVTIPGADYSQQISDRPNGDMIIKMVKVNQGAVYHAEEILRVALEEIRPDDGARNESITLTGHSTGTFGSKIVELQGAVFKTGSAGKKRFRLAIPDIFLRPGDTATHETDSILVDNISYTVGEGQQLMEVAE